jgi:hypothetical protein
MKTLSVLMPDSSVARCDLAAAWYVNKVRNRKKKRENVKSVAAMQIN